MTFKQRPKGREIGSGLTASAKALNQERWRESQVVGEENRELVAMLFKSLQTCKKLSIFKVFWIDSIAYLIIITGIITNLNDYYRVLSTLTYLVYLRMYVSTP